MACIQAVIKAINGSTPQATIATVATGFVGAYALVMVAFSAAALGAAVEASPLLQLASVFTGDDIMGDILSGIFQVAGISAAVFMLAGFMIAFIHQPIGSKVLYGIVGAALGIFPAFQGGDWLLVAAIMAIVGMVTWTWALLSYHWDEIAMAIFGLVLWAWVLFSSRSDKAGGGRLTA